MDLIVNIWVKTKTLNFEKNIKTKIQKIKK